MQNESCQASITNLGFVFGLSDPIRQYGHESPTSKPRAALPKNLTEQLMDRPQMCAADHVNHSIYNSGSQVVIRRNSSKNNDNEDQMPWQNTAIGSSNMFAA